MVAFNAHVTRDGQLIEIEPIPKDWGEEDSAVVVRRYIRAEIAHTEESVFGVILVIWVESQIFQEFALLQERIPGIELNIGFVV
jgi:hypothetical protein